MSNIIRCRNQCELINKLSVVFPLLSIAFYQLHRTLKIDCQKFLAWKSKHPKSLLLVWIKVSAWSLQWDLWWNSKTFDSYIKQTNCFSPLTNNKVNPKDNSTKDNLLLCNDTPSLDNSSALVFEDMKFRLEIKENLLIKRDKPHRKNIYSAQLRLFHKVNLFPLFNS